MRMTEEGYADMMAKRTGMKPGRMMTVGAHQSGKTAMAMAKLREQVKANPDMTTAVHVNGEWIIEKPVNPSPKTRSRTAEMRTARQALQKATGEVVRKESAIEIQFAQQIHLLKLPKPKRNYLFNPPRKQELDFAWPERKIAVEVQGMVHRIKGRFNADMEKRALALLAGWKILEVGGREIRNGVASKWLEQLLAQDADNELRRIGYPL